MRGRVQERELTEANVPSSANTANASATDQRVHIVPAAAIGLLRIGGLAADLPAAIRATIADRVGDYESIQFHVDNDGVIRDVWINDILSFPRELLLEGRPVPREANEKKLTRFFGPCHPAPGGRGGREVICDRGVRLIFHEQPDEDTGSAPSLSSVMLRVGVRS